MGSLSNHRVVKEKQSGQVPDQGSVQGHLSLNLFFLTAGFMYLYISPYI